MSVSWVDINNGDNLGSIRSAINTFNTSVVTDVKANTTNISSLASTVSSNTSAISTNTSNIATNTSAISVLDTRLTAEEGKYTYDYNQVTNFTVTNDVYENVLTLTTPSRVKGTYKFSASMIYSLNSTTTSAFFRYSLDGGSTWLEIKREPKDNTDKTSEAYFTTIVLNTPQIFNILIQARKEVSTDTLLIFTIDAMIERVA